ncbi:chloride channel protein, partial [Enterococcus faecium]|uniref:chloride channel protein n=1 Tax=Enterococcus faecium TaxID=1352 RepID=UPI003DA10C6C
MNQLLNGNSTSVLDRSFFMNLGDNPWIIIVYLILIIGFKILASAACNGAGGVGCIFAPTLFIGAITGFVLAHI